MAASTWKEVNELIMYGSMSESDEEDVLLLMLEGEKKERSYQKKIFDITLYSEDDCKESFRFESQHLNRLANALKFPDTMRCVQGTTATKMEALCVMLRRLSYPNRFCDLEKQFGRSRTELSYIFDASINHVYDHYSQLLTNLSWVTEAVQERFAYFIREKGAPLPKCWGFIDGTARQICRPTYNQKACFSGHKRYHAMKYQSVMTPDGIIAHMFGPVEGKRHDIGMLNASGLYAKMERQFGYQIPHQYYLYGDPGYVARPLLMAPYKGSKLSPTEIVANKAMSTVRQCVEWGFGKILQNFAFVDYEKNQKLYMQPVGKYYLVATVLTNCHTCLYGSTTTSFFNCDPPTLEEYLAR